MSSFERLRRALFGAPRDIKDPHAFHKLSLVALLAWVGLGADGLSSSAYGPEEAYRQLGEHRGLAVFLALAMAGTVFIISYGYSRIIEHFPSGGGGYVVASKLLGPRIGVLSGAALLVDYVLTITISIASGADQIFSFLPEGWLGLKLGFAFFGLLLLTLMNLRGVKESVTAIAPVFVLFLLTHAVVLLIAIGSRVGHAGRVVHELSANVSHTSTSLGLIGTLGLFVRAYSLGGGTYTGIEAVSNGMSIMREPRVRTAQRTMVLMATSLALTAGGILLAYLLVDVTPLPGKTLNFVLFERVAGGWQLLGLPLGRVFVVLSLLSEGALLFVAAQAGFLDGPRVMANMATDSWLPHRFSALSERLTMRNGVVLMASAGALSLIYTHGDVSKLVVMYSINVFLTFTLSNLAMTLFWVRERRRDASWYRHLPAHVAAALLCATILAITVYEKLAEGGWLTVLITALLTLLCFAIRRHYRLVGRAVQKLDRELPGHEENPELYGLTPIALDRLRNAPEPAVLARDKPLAVVFVGGYGGLGRHALLTLLRMFPGHFAGVIFVSIAVVDSDSFKGIAGVKELEHRTEAHLTSYRAFARALGLPAQSRYVVGTEVAVEAERLGQDVLREYPHALVVAGQLIFAEDTAWNRLLHNETAFMIQRRLQHVGVPMVVLPVQLDLRAVGSELRVRRPTAELAA
jgi:amino acid transporter